MSTLLNEWYRNAAKFNEGTIETTAKPYARPGMALLYLPTTDGRAEDFRDIGIYYIDNVNHTYNLGKADRTTFTVIRGTPLPMNGMNLATLLLDWELAPVGLHLADGDFR